ncbi:hypothetical protein D3C77_812520 [compost metagenome]
MGPLPITVRRLALVGARASTATAVVAAVRAVVSSPASHNSSGWPLSMDISNVQAVISGAPSRTM